MIASSGGRREMMGVFRVKNHDFTPKNHIFSNCEGRRENVWGISCEKSRFYAKKIYFFPILGGGGRRGRPPLDPPLHYWVTIYNKVIIIAKIGVSDM
jgi:hypothetical protein